MKAWIGLAILPLLAGCNGLSQREYEIDNPTGAPIEVRIDDAAYTVPAHLTKPVSLAPGEHTLEAPLTGKVRFIVYADRGKGGGLINPTLGAYVVVQQVYVTDKSKLENFGNLEHLIQIDGVDFKGPFTRYDGLFIDRNWDFGVREPFPHTVTKSYIPAEGGNFFLKIFTAPDFVDFYEKAVNDPGYFEKNRKAAPPPALPQPPPELPVFADADIQAASLKLRETCQRYLHAADPTEQRQLQKDFSKQTMEFLDAIAPLQSKQSREENDKYEVFINTLNAIFGSSALVER